MATGENVVRSCGAVAVCIGPGEMGPWQQRETNMALERQAREREFPVIPVLLPGAEPVLGFLNQNTSIDFRSGPSDSDLIGILAGAIRRNPLVHKRANGSKERLPQFVRIKGYSIFVKRMQHSSLDDRKQSISYYAPRPTIIF